MKVGDYVRLDRFQGINRVDEYDEYTKKYSLKCCIYDEWGDETFLLDEADVIKSSPNIIDLIEVGDYVNGSYVLDLDTLQIGEKSVIVDGLVTYGWGQGVIPVSEIKSIVTKEQFESVEYRIGE